MDEANEKPYTPSGDIQIILSKSYSLFFFAFIIGLILDFIFKARIGVPTLMYAGVVIVFLSSIWIYWAQTVNKAPKYLPNGDRNFMLGPYKYSRHPTYFGISMLMLGAGFVTDSASVVVTAVTAFVISVFTFMTKEEKRHIKKYGDNYLAYMKKVRKVI